MSEFGPGGAWGDWDPDSGEMEETAQEQIANSQAVSDAVADMFGPGGAYGGDVGADTEGVANTAEQQLVNVGLDPGDIQSRAGQAFGGEGDYDDPDPDPTGSTDPSGTGGANTAVLSVPFPGDSGGGNSGAMNDIPLPVVLLLALAFGGLARQRGWL